MSYIVLLLGHIKRIFATRSLLFSLVALPLIVNTAVILMNQDPSTNQDSVAISIQDEDFEWENVIPESFHDQLYFGEEADALSQLMETAELAVIYEIPDGFSNQLHSNNPLPIRRVLREGGSGDVAFESALAKELQAQQVSNLLASSGLSDDRVGHSSSSFSTVLFDSKELDTNYLTTILMLILYVLINASFVSSDMISFKKNNVLRRMILSPHKDSRIISSMIVAFTLFLFTTNGLVLFLTKLFIRFEIPNLPLVLLMLFVTCFFSLCLSFFFFRVFKNEGLAQFVGIFYTVGGMLLFQIAKEGTIVHYLSLFTPFYWIFESIDKNQLFPNVIVLLLMGLVFLTAGSYRLRDFIKA